MSRRWQGVVLKDGERILHEFSPSFFLPGLVWAVVSLFTLGFAVPFWLLHYWLFKQNRWAVTDQRMIARLGAFSRRTVSVPKDKITDITVIRPLLSSLLHNGQVLINTAGTSARELRIFGQPDPDLVHAEIEEALGF